MVKILISAISIALVIQTHVFGGMHQYVDKKILIDDEPRAPTLNVSGPPSESEIRTDDYIRMLRSTNGRERRDAAEMLGEGKDPRAVEPLIKSMENAFSPLDNIVTNTKEEFYRALSNTRESAIDDDLVDSVFRALIQIGIHTPAPYETALRSKNLFLRWSILQIIRSSKSEHSGNLYAIAMKDESEVIRNMVVHAMEDVQVQGAQAIALLIQALKDQSEHVRKDARRSFESIGSRQRRVQNPQVLSAVVDAVTDNSAEVRAAAVEFLTRVNHPVVVKPLLQALEDKEDAIRLKAVKALGPLKDPAAVDGLIECLSHRDPDIRLSAAESLGMIGDPRSIDRLIVIMKDEITQVRWAARYSLIRIGPPARDKLIAALREPDGNIRRGAAHALGNLRDPEAVPALIAALRDETYGVNSEAIGALGVIPDPRAVDALMDATKTKDKGLIQPIVIALGNQKDKRAVDLLIMLFETKRYPWTAWALGEIGDRKAVPPIMEYFKVAPHHWKPELLEALGKLGGPGVLDLLVSSLNDPDRDVPMTAAKALKRLKDPRSVPTLLAALQKHIAVSDVIEALGEIKDPASIPDLVRVMNDVNVDLFDRQRASAALVNIGASSVGPLIAVMQDKTSRSRGLAIEALGKIKEASAVEPLIAATSETSLRRSLISALEAIGPPAVEPLIALLASRHEMLQLSTIRALGNIKDKRGTEPLLRMLKEGGISQKAAAATALGLIGDPRAVEPIIEMLGSQNYNVRLKSIEALGELRDPRALPYLRTAESDTSEDIRKVTKKAIQQINAVE